MYCNWHQLTYIDDDMHIDPLSVGRPFYPLLIRFMTAAPLIALALERENAIVAWHELMGPTNPEVAKEKAPRRYVHVHVYGLLIWIEVR